MGLKIGGNTTNSFAIGAPFGGGSSPGFGNKSFGSKTPGTFGQTQVQNQFQVNTTSHALRFLQQQGAFGGGNPGFNQFGGSQQSLGSSNPPYQPTPVGCYHSFFFIHFRPQR
jgi:hypothetical protein